MKAKLKLLGELYVSFLKLGAVSFGGGYAMISLIEKEVVEGKGWLKEEEIVDILALSGTLPGAIALNASTFVGFKIGGILGALAALLGNLTAPVIIMLTLSIAFVQIKDNPIVAKAFLGIRPAVIALIAYAGYKIFKMSIKDVYCFILMIISFVALTFFGIAPIPVIAFGAVAGIVISNLVKIFNNERKMKNAN